MIVVQSMQCLMIWIYFQIWFNKSILSILFWYSQIQWLTVYSSTAKKALSTTQCLGFIFSESVLFHRYSCPVDHFEYQWPTCRRGFPCYTNRIQILPTPIPNTNADQRSGYPMPCMSQCICFVTLTSQMQKLGQALKNWRWTGWRIQGEVEELGRELKLRGGGAPG